MAGFKHEVKNKSGLQESFSGPPALINRLMQFFFKVHLDVHFNRRRDQAKMRTFIYTVLVLHIVQGCFFIIRTFRTKISLAERPILKSLLLYMYL